MRPHFASIIILLSSTAGAAAQAPAGENAISIAEAYLAAYGTFDVSKMAPF